MQLSILLAQEAESPKLQYKKSPFPKSIPQVNDSETAEAETPISQSPGAQEFYINL
jgi:hypothetical protein